MLQQHECNVALLLRLVMRLCLAATSPISNETEHKRQQGAQILKHCKTAWLCKVRYSFLSVEHLPATRPIIWVLHISHDVQLTLP